MAYCMGHFSIERRYPLHEELALRLRPAVRVGTGSTDIRASGQRASACLQTNVRYLTRTRRTSGRYLFNVKLGEQTHLEL